MACSAPRFEEGKVGDYAGNVVTVGSLLVLPPLLCSFHELRAGIEGRAVLFHCSIVDQHWQTNAVAAASTLLSYMPAMLMLWRPTGIVVS